MAGCVESYSVLDFLVGLECQKENRPSSGQQHQAQFGLNPALGKGRQGEKRWREEGAREKCEAYRAHIKVASPPLLRSLVERRSWAADLAHPKIFAWRPLWISCRDDTRQHCLRA